MDQVDAETALLILQLQLEDLDVLKTRRGKRSAGAAKTPQDQDVALEMVLQELTAQKISLEDQILCESMSRAMMADSRVLAAEIEAENIGTRDRTLAQQMYASEQGGTGACNPSLGGGGMAEPDTGYGDMEFFAKLTAKYMSAEQGTKLFRDAKLSKGTAGRNNVRTVAESSSRGSQRSNGGASAAIDRRCEACHETLKFYDLATLPCAHEYCRDCLDQLVLLATTDESLFPPRCCRQPIPTEDPAIRIFITNETYRTFTAKRPELSTPNRTYCHRERCSAWIPPSRITGDVGSCPRCGTFTCSMCKGRAHGNNDCPGDEATHALLRTADQEAWQRCYQCRTVVELNTGCNHITCRCHAEFCYVCSARWKTCDCPQWDEDMLEGRAAQIAERRRARPLANIQAPMPVPDRASAAVPAPAPDPVSGLAHRFRALDLAPAPATPPLPVPALDRTLAAEARRIADFFNPDHMLEMQQIVDHLRDNHECDHDNWRNIREADTCEECGDYMKYYIFECKACALRACQRCRRNRL